MIFIITYWKEIAIGLLAILLVATGAYVSHVFAERKLLQEQLDHANAKIVEVAKANEDLQKAVVKREDELKKYVALTNDIQKQKQDIENKYTRYVERVANEKLPINSKGTIDKPITIIDAGVPTFSDYSTGRNIR